jgi:hypothetical protein
MTADAILFPAITGLIGLLLGLAAYYAKKNSDRLENDLKDLETYIRGKVHTFNNFMAGAIMRTEYQDEVKSIRQAIRDIELRIDRLRDK